MHGEVTALRPTWPTAGLPASVIQDLLTDWVPDPIGGLGINWTAPERPGAEVGGRLQVATSAGWRDVPVASLEFRAWAHASVDRAIGRLERVLKPSVFGYRDGTTPYRRDWARLGAMVAATTEVHGPPLRLDVKNFFANVRPESAAGLVPEAVLNVMRAAMDHHGSALLPGHRWSRRCANLLLRSADDVLTIPFARWQDDYWLFGRGAELQDNQRMLDRALADLGLSLSHTKTTSQARRQWSPPSDARNALAVAMKTSNVAGIKHSLRRLEECGDPAALPHLPQILDAHPVLAPRIAMYLAANITEPRSRGLLRSLLRHCRSEWVIGRLIAAACYSEDVARRMPQESTDLLAGSSMAASRGLAARIQTSQRRPAVSADVRIDKVLRAASPRLLLSHPPVVQTTL